MMQSTAISNPIFVVGPSRSGTTWLKCMLAVHEEFLGFLMIWVRPVI